MRHLVSIARLPLVLLALLTSGSCGPSPPRLVVVIVVDQMRADYVERFGPELQHGLAAILQNGAVFTNGRVGYAVSHTAPGHATISTGDYPKHHGIVNNGWWSREWHKDIAATEDEKTRLVPVGSLEPDESRELEGHSPRMLSSETLGDRLKAFSRSSKVFAISIKARSAVLLGGHRPNGVYWYDDHADGFVTSTFYDHRYPQWLVDFNSTIADREEGDNLSFALAARIIDAEQLGRDEASDLLWISAARGDHLGHRYGPDSPELRKYYDQLDKLIGVFMDWLDDRVGRDRYVLVLASDHGVRPLVESLTAQGIDARNLEPEEMRAPAAQAVAAAAEHEGLDQAIDSLWIDGVVLDPQDRDRIPPDRQEPLRRAIAAELRQLDVVADSYTYDELASTTGPDRPYLEMFRRSFHAGRGPDVVVNFRPSYLCGHSVTGHGTPYDYDQLVPLAFFGSGIPARRSEEAVGLVDIAPTLAELLGLPAGDEFDGRSLHLERR